MNIVSGYYCLSEFFLLKLNLMYWTDLYGQPEMPLSKSDVFKLNLAVTAALR